MGYYHIELSPSSKRLCTIVLLLFGKYEYQRLLMGLCNSPDIFQEKMSKLMCDLEYVRTYIDVVIAITTGDWDDHLEKLKEILKRLADAGLQVNAKKISLWKTRTRIPRILGNSRRSPTSTKKGRGDLQYRSAKNKKGTTRAYGNDKLLSRHVDTSFRHHSPSHHSNEQGGKMEMDRG